MNRLAISNSCTDTNTPPGPLSPLLLSLPSLALSSLPSAPCSLSLSLLVELVPAHHAHCRFPCGTISVFDPTSPSSYLSPSFSVALSKVCGGSLWKR